MVLIGGVTMEALCVRLVHWVTAVGLLEGEIRRFEIIRVGDDLR